VHALSTHRGAVSGQCNALVHCTHVPSSQYGVLPLQVGLQMAGASGIAASLLDDGGASRCMAASDIVEDALAALHHPAEQYWPSRHCSSVEHAIDGSDAQPAVTAAPSNMHRANARI